ncbi:MAG TPA: IS21 family transposase [Gemmatimonadales bacterium]|nr:IS21 family transposase [Gemmatimonadales bacterium]
MLPFAAWARVHALARHGRSIRGIAQDLSLDRKTVRRALGQPQPVPYHREARPGMLAPHEAYLRVRAPEIDYNAWRLFQELEARGYTGGYETVKRAVRPLRQAERVLAEATVRFETAPGRQAQVDWTSTWLTYPDGRRRAQAFVMVLGYSRAMYVEFTADQRLETLLRCHEHAFDWFGGLTEEIVYDNPKTVVLRRNAEGSQIEWHPVFWDFARYYGIVPRLCRPYRARTKGKVESGIKYVKRAFVLGREGRDLEDWTAQGHRWIREVADQRLHGTTHEQPAVRLAQERLRPRDGRPPFQLYTALVRTVARDCCVTVDTNRYSVPAAFIGREVEIQYGPQDTLCVYAQGQLIATHPRQTARYQALVTPVHIAGLPGGPVLVPRISIPGPLPEVEVRDLAVYEALAGVEA